MTIAHRSVSSALFAALMLMLAVRSVSAEMIDYANSCDEVTLGPITLLGSTAFPATGTIDLTPNVAVPGFSIVSAGGIRRVDDRTVTSGTFTGTLTCTLTIGGVHVGYSQSLSLSISTNGPCTEGDGSAAACLVTGPATVEVDLAPAVGKAIVTTPGSTTLGYDSHLVTGGIIVVPGALVDTAELVCTAASGCLERCDDCLDDNADGLVDYDDPDCQARANGNGAGFGQPKPEGKAIVKCGKTLQRTGGKLAATRVKHLQKCLATAFACVQLKPNDDACTAKAGAVCTKELGALAKDRTTLTAKVTKACAEPAVAVAALHTSTGLGFENESERCAARGVATLASVGDVAACIASAHQCDAEAAVGFEIPRAAELLTVVGRNPAIDAPCLPPAATTFGLGITDAANAKAAVKCAKAITKAGAGFVGNKQKLVQKCLAAVTACVQQKPGDAACVTKAGTTCAKAIAKIDAPGSGLEAKLAAAIGKKCGVLSADDLTGFRGLGYHDRRGDCTALAGPLASATDVAACVVRQHECRAERLLETQTPRLRELLGLAGVGLPGTAP